jgi:hypothetical protein
MKMEIGVLEALVRKLEQQQKVMKNQLYTGELPDGNEVREHEEYITTLGNFEVTLKAKCQYDFYADEESREILMQIDMRHKPLEQPLIIKAEKNNCLYKLLSNLLETYRHKAMSVPKCTPQEAYQELKTLVL